MLVREVLEKEKEEFNRVATHPLQSWEWGEFRQKTGRKVIRLGAFDPSARASTELSRMSSGQVKLKAGYQLTVHLLPKTSYCILYFPKGPMPDKVMLEALAKLGREEEAILVKMEPNVGGPVGQTRTQACQEIKEFLLENGCRSGRPLFTPYTFQIDLTQDENELLANMKEKTRYNIRLSSRHGVEVVEDNSLSAFKIYLKLMIETTKRQRFYAHTPQYHQKMWETLKPSGIAHLFLARYKGEVLAAWIFFTFNNILYYPYGGSSRKHKEVMPAYAMIWEAIKFGKKVGCHTFDLWGCLGPDPNPRDPWFGFHHFKAGFGGKLIEFIGTYDLVINPRLYPLYNLTDTLRWKLLRLKACLPI